MNFPIFPPQASTLATKVDLLYFTLLGTCGFVLCGLLIVMLYFLFKYRRGRPAKRSRSPLPSTPFELTCTFIPLVIFMGLFPWGAIVYNDQQATPPGALEINVVGKQWMWKLQHEGGQRENNELHVPVGQAVKLTLASQDVIHSFYIPAFRIKQVAVPGLYRTLWFEATKPGTYHLFCAEYCGTNHSGMMGQIVVMEPMAYQQWLGGYTADTPVEEGQKLFTAYDCVSCHATGQRRRGPNLGNLYGSQVELEDGARVVFDETYIRESILEPMAKVVRGFPPVMPTFRGQLSEEQILALIAYIKSLTPESGGAGVAGSAQ